jgi:hypothetical protein
VLLRLAYLTVANTFAVLRLLPMGDRDKDTETWPFAIRSRCWSANWDRQLYRGAPTEALAHILDLIAPAQQEVELLAPSGEVLLDLPTGLVESSGRAQDARADRRSAVGPPVLRCGG